MKADKLTAGSHIWMITFLLDECPKRDGTKWNRA